MILGPELHITVRGLPAPQGSKNVNSYGSTYESSKKVKPWRADVRDAAEKLVLCGCPDDCGALAPGYPLDGPLLVSMVFTFVRPRSHYRTGRNAHLLKDTAPARPKGTPDLSKLLRSTEDALTSAGAWKDDALVVEYRRAAKVWAGEDPDALDVPGAVIRIWPLLALAVPVPNSGPEPTCAYPAGEDQGEHDHALCEDVVAERAAEQRVDECTHGGDCLIHPQATGLHNHDRETP